MREPRPVIRADYHTLSGTPRIAGTRISTDTIVSLFRAGDSILDIALAYEIREECVEAAVAFETTTHGQVTKAAWAVRRLFHAIAESIGPREWRL